MISISMMDIIERIKKSADQVIGNNISLSEYNYVDIRMKYKIPRDKYLVMYYGVIGREHGLKVLLKAYKNLKSEMDNVALILCGNGNSPWECKRYIIENNLRDVWFITGIKPRERYIYLSQSDIIILPASLKSLKYKRYMITVDEALKYSKHIIASREIQRSSENIVDGQNGFLIEEGSVDDLHAAMGTLLTNPILLSRI